MDPDLRRESDYRCFWFDKDDRGWDGYLEWCKRTEKNLDADAQPSRFDELDEFEHQRYLESHPESGPKVETMGGW